MSEQHTQEPLEACGHLIRTTRDSNGKGGHLVAELPFNYKDDAKRLAACWNACAGITTAGLESWLNPPEGSLGAPHGTWPAQLRAMWDEYAKVGRERDKLLEAVRMTVAENGHLADGDNCTLKRLTRVLAEVEGGAA